MYSLKKFILFIFIVGYVPLSFATVPGFADPYVAKIFSEANECDIAPQAIVPEKEFCDVIKTFADSRRVVSHGRPYIQKLIAKPKDIFIIIGDIHGYPRALIKNLLYLKVIGLLGHDLTLDSNVKMIFTGDFADRGMYGADVWYLVLSLANKNPDNVFILRGNHETEGIARRYGFAEELEVRYGMKLKDTFTEIFSLCASALYLDINGEFIQINHGGMIPPAGGTPRDCTDIVNFLQNKRFSQIPIDDSTNRAFLWNDYVAGKAVEQSRRGNGIYKIGVERAKSMHEKNGIKAVFHGHQHNQFVVSYRNKDGVRKRLPGNLPALLSTSHIYTFMSLSEKCSGFGILNIGHSFDSSILMSIET